ncbi:MAG TPA: hypothetical protein VGD98_05475 [Ktedonobacteraceae bacterium]
MSKNIVYPAYLSEQNIQALLKQIHKDELKTIATELGINMQLLSPKLALAPNDKQQALFAQALVVATYLEKYYPNQIGTIDEARKYVKGTLTMFSHFLHSRTGKPDLAYFSGSTSQTILSLAGSASSVYVPTQTEIANKNGSRLASTLPFLLEMLGSDMEIHSARFYMDDPDMNLALAFYSIRALQENARPSVSYSFFARVQLDSTYLKADLQPSKHIVLAAPLYIVNTVRV